MDNYPPGFDPKSLDNPYAELAEYIRDNTTVRINITVEVDDEVIYEDYSSDIEDFEGSCVRKAEHAIEQRLTELTDAAFERDED